MTSFNLKIGETFIADYNHGGSLAGVTVTSSVKSGAATIPLTFAVVDEAAGLGRFTANTSAWAAGNYEWDVKTVGGGVTDYTEETIAFRVIAPVTP